MNIVHQGTAPLTAVVAPAQHCKCGTANDPSSLDIERMLRADRTRFTYFSTVASHLAASWRKAAR